MRKAYAIVQKRDLRALVPVVVDALWWAARATWVMSALRWASVV